MKQLFVFSIVILSSLSLRSQLQFVENQGQWSSSVHAVVSSSDASITLVSDGIVFSVSDFSCERSDPDSIQKTQFKLQWIDCNEVIPEKQSKVKTTYNFFVGATKERWRSGVSAFEKIKYLNLYNGIDLIIYSKNNALKYDFVVHPGADPGQIKWTFTNAETDLNQDGSISIVNEVNTIKDAVPFAYQLENSIVTEVECANVKSEKDYKYQLSNYDPSKKLIIDPEINWSTYSSLIMTPWASATNSLGQTLLYGSLSSEIAVEGANFFMNENSQLNIAIQCVNQEGSDLDWVTFIGGDGWIFVDQIAITESDEIIVSGNFLGEVFPTTPEAYQTEVGENFLIKLAFDGSEMLVSTFFDLPGIQFRVSRSQLVGSTLAVGESFESINVTSNGVLVSFTAEVSSGSIDFTNYYGEEGGNIAFYVLMNDALSEVLWTTGLASDGSCTCEYGYPWTGCNINHSYTFETSNNELISCGWTFCSAGFISPDAYDSSFEGVTEGWMAKMDLETGELLHATYVGGADMDQAWVLSEKQNGDIGLVGTSNSEDLVTLFPLIENGRVFIKEFDSNLLPTGATYRVGFDESLVQENHLKNVRPVFLGYDACSNPIVFIESLGKNNTLDLTQGILGWPLVNNSRTAGPMYFFQVDRFTGNLNFGDYYGGGARHHALGLGLPENGILNFAVCTEHNTFGLDAWLPITANAMNDQTSANNANITQFDFSSTTPPNFDVNVSSELISSDCLSSEFLLSTDFLSATEYQWSIDGNSFFPTDNGSLIYEFLQPGIHEVELMVSDLNACNFVDTISFEIEVPDTGSDMIATWEVSAIDSCFYPQEVFLEFTGQGADEYTWTLPNEIVDGGVQSQFSITQPGSYAFSLEVYDALCDSSMFLNNEVQIHQSPELSLVYSISENGICEPMDLISWVEGEEVESTTWILNNDVVSASDVYNVELLEGQFNLSVDLERTCGPNSFIEQLITIPELPANYYFQIPNVFTPQNDAINDHFRIIDPIEEEKLAQFDFKIFNSWGQEVFQSNKPTFSWNGESNGIPLSDGTYFFTLKYELHCGDEVRNQNGSLMILR